MKKLIWNLLFVPGENVPLSFFLNDPMLMLGYSRSPNCLPQVWMLNTLLESYVSVNRNPITDGQGFKNKISFSKYLDVP